MQGVRVQYLRVVIDLLGVWYACFCIILYPAKVLSDVKPKENGYVQNYNYTQWRVILKLK